ncbi:hypothetical protein R0H17_08920 [Phytobacter diazotrophicus]|uniref:hypothetical protein n=1 Tax=Phytobacter diazotrophicus TaxID=395631 RepID=UPI002935C44B|nr:hypothetical protein [Phytobacter diazotrophicus]MDV2901750.1 hypothetical protein [Phytobacter diazotrophicus]
MSLIHEILKYIEAHPGTSAADLRLVFHRVPRTVVQRAAYRLYESEFTTREMIKGQYCYFAAKSYPETGGMPLDEITRSHGLVRKAQELQSKGLYLRAATMWLEAFDASRLTEERAYCLDQRLKCLENRAHSACGERVYDLPGRFVG